MADRPLGWRLRVRHRTVLGYAGPVWSSYNEARMTPCAADGQTVLDAALTVQPAARTYRYHDYWGTAVTAFDVQAPHDQLEVLATATVDTAPPASTQPDGEWAQLAEPAVVDRLQEYLLHTPRSALDEELTRLSQEIRAQHANPQAAAEAACALVRAQIRYMPGSTGVLTDAVQVWRQREGVCQDLSHLSLGLLRAMGIPARYVSGYLHPMADAAIGAEVTGQSHAWVQWFAGGWYGFDPTNGVPVGGRHIVLGHGREYGDVSPLKGVYAGPASSGQQVEVHLTRLR